MCAYLCGGTWPLCFLSFQKHHTDFNNADVGSEKGDQERIKIDTEKGCGDSS